MRHHHACSRAHQVGALLLVAATFLLTRLFDRLLLDASSPSSSSFHLNPARPTQSVDLRIYVYAEDEIQGLRALLRGRDGTVAAATCLKGQWGTQVKIHQLLLKSRFRTFNKDQANLFFVPSYVKCVRMTGALNDKEINQTYVKVNPYMIFLDHMIYACGRDHIFVFPSNICLGTSFYLRKLSCSGLCSGAGAHLFRSWATFLNRSIILTPEVRVVVLFTYNSACKLLRMTLCCICQGDRTDKRGTSAFNTWKDIIIPGNVDDSMVKSDGRAVQPIALTKRKYLANFLGRAQGKIGRLQLVKLAKQYPDKLESPELKLSGPNKLGRIDYFKHLRNAKFCLAPRGESSWTLRFYESFFVECVPVILSDEVELPFQNVIDYSEISIKWPSTRIGPELFEYLESIPDQRKLIAIGTADERIEEMIDRGREIRCLWVYASDTEPCSAMSGILSELQSKVRRFHQSPETFWLHNRSIVNRDLVEFHGWKTPVPLP
ncbi:hypothetical protein HU200_026159 [Digitaria exilis]|uniref:Exostosin GT47 domain-containing protein n=1 Tax=Digitaria exilis TaxID=1010633 RepID=A0A835BW90_9POAL|nr:hypothetical protein HU200_026159 [Digitaria exilis]